MNILNFKGPIIVTTFFYHVVLFFIYLAIKDEVSIKGQVFK
jgi:hypothetical protein